MDDDIDNIPIYEMYVQMTCNNCVKTVENTLNPICQNIYTLDLQNELVIAKCSESGDRLVSALDQAGIKAKVIGISSSNLEKLEAIPPSVGSLDDSLAVVSEFRGEQRKHGSIMGVVRLVQTSARSALVQASFTGLLPNSEYSIAIHKSGVQFEEGPIYDRDSQGATPSGMLGSIKSNQDGQAEFRKIVRNILIWDIIGRRLAVHQGDPIVASSILARSASVGSNHKTLCTCDGISIWDPPKDL